MVGVCVTARTLGGALVLYRQLSKTLLVALLVLLYPLTLWAQDSTYPRVYVIPSQPVGDSSNLPESFSSAVVSNVGDSPVVVISPLASAKSDGSTAALAAKLKEGKKLVDSSPEKAVDIFKAAADGYESIMASEEDFMNYLAA